MTGETNGVVKLMWTTAIFVAAMGMLGFLATTFPEFADGATRLTSGLIVVERPATAVEPQTYRCRMNKDFEIEAAGSQVRTTQHATVCGSENSKTKTN